MSASHHFIKEFVRDILQKRHRHAWSVHGLGMLRCNLNQSLRLHVWSPDTRTVGVTDTHTHPWDFRSLVVAGLVVNTSYFKTTSSAVPNVEAFREWKVACGAGGHGPLEVGPCYLGVISQLGYEEGQGYSHRATDIHSGNPMPGTVTLIQRTFLGDSSKAYVYVPEGHRFGDAVQRPAYMHEIEEACDLALGAWF